MMMRKLLMLLMMLVAVMGMDDSDDWDKMMEEPADRAHWVDPWDMGLYDGVKPESCLELEQRLKTCDSELVSCKKSVEKVAKELAALRSNSSGEGDKTVEVKTMSDTVFLRRHVNFLISKLKLDPARDYDSHLKLEIALRPDQIQTLFNFVSLKPTTHAVDVDSILSSYIKSVEEYQPSPLLDIIRDKMVSAKDPLLVILMSISLVYIMIIVFRRLPPFKVLMLVLVVCFVWNWIKLYKDALASKHSKMLQSQDIPAECRPDEMSWLQSIQSSFSGAFSNVDKCEEYHKALLVDPLYEVNPLHAMVDLIISLVLHPLSRLGEAVGKMFSGLLSSVPLVYQIPILVLFSFILLFVMVLVFGYKIRLPCFLGEIAPANVDNNKNSAALEQEIKELKTLMCQIQPQSLPLESQPTSRKTSSGVEEIKPLGYDIQLRNHEREEPRPIPKSLQTTPSKKRNRDVILTPVKGRVLSQPNIFKPSVQDDVDGVDDDIVDLTMKKSDSFPKTPTKSLVAKSCSSPSATKFEWIQVENSSVLREALMNENYSKEEKANDDNNLPGDKPKFLDKVEELFDNESNEL